MAVNRVIILKVLEYFCIWIALSYETRVSAQIVRGCVIDDSTCLPVCSVLVFEKKSGKQMSTDTLGRFVVYLEKKINPELSFYRLGYRKQTVRLPYFNKDTFFVFRLKNNSKQIAEVEVKASPLRQILTRSYSVTIIDSSLIEDRIATSLIDVLEYVPGITKMAEYHSPIVLRGLKGKRLLITKDGNRRMGSFPDGFMGQGINIYDLAKIEVIKGPASVKYGPGAITGIINLESKAPFLQPGWHGKILTSYGTNNKEKNTIAGLNWCNLDHALSLSCRFRDADNFKYGGYNTTAENSEYRDKDFRAFYSYENNYGLRLTAESELHLGGPWGRPVGFNGSDYIRVYNNCDNTWHSAVTALLRPDTNIKQMVLSIYFDKEKREMINDSYDVGTGKLSYREDIRYENFYGGWRAMQVKQISKHIELSSGTDGVWYRISSPTTNTDYFLTAVINNKVTKHAGVLLAGLFSEAEYASENSKLRIRCGLRGDYSQIHEGDVHDTALVKGRNSYLFAWNATSSVVYNFWKQMFGSLQIARSCRMPDASEMFITSSNSDGLIYGNSSLKPEYGLNFDAGIRGKAGNWYFDYSLFANFFHNFISLEYWTNSGKKGINYTYYNVDRARIMGIEFALGSKWLHVLHPDNVITYNATVVYTLGDKLTGSPDWFSSGVPLRNIPPLNTKHEIIFRRLISSAKSLYIGIDYLYYTRQNRIAPSSDGGYESPFYNLLGAMTGFTYRYHSQKWDLKFRVDNITDNYYYPFESLVPGMGRNFKVLLSVVF
jgi:outer membrane receptor protein involved in Fe transport